MKKLICVLLAGVMALSFAACSSKNDKNGKDAQSESQTQSAGSALDETTELVYENTVTASVPVKETDDWYSYDFTKLDDKEDYKISLSIPDGYTIDGTVIYDESGNKYAEINGVVVLKEGQTFFDSIEADTQKGDYKYLGKLIDKLEYGGVTRTAGVAVAEVPDDNGKDSHYIYDYAIDAEGYTVEISFVVKEFIDEVPEEHKAILASIKVS